MTEAMVTKWTKTLSRKETGELHERNKIKLNERLQQKTKAQTILVPLFFSRETYCVSSIPLFFLLKPWPKNKSSLSPPKTCSLLSLFSLAFLSFSFLFTRDVLAFPCPRLTNFFFFCQLQPTPNQTYGWLFIAVTSMSFTRLLWAVAGGRFG